MKIKIFGRALGALSIMSCAAFGSVAQAAVITWGYDVNSNWSSASYNGAGGTAAGAGVTTLSWGTSTGFGQSSLSIGNNPASGSVDTYFGVVPPAAPPYLGFTTSLTHSNNPITGTSLTSAVLSSAVILDPIVPNNPALPQFVVNFDIAFTETPNSGTCAVSTSPTPCNDIFVLTGGLLNFSFVYDDGTGPSTYFINIFPTTGGVLNVLENTACAAAGQPNGCIGFSTPEGQATTLAFGFTVSTQPLQRVPEPATLALVGVALAGLGFSSRKRRV